jgi:DNA-binding FrmR family transcriptional regulator
MSGCTQVSAATKALESGILSLLGAHLSHCVAQAAEEGGPVATQTIRETNETIAHLVHS